VEEKADVACGLLSRPELQLTCGCTIPVLACQELGAFGRLIPEQGQLNGVPAQVFRDTGCTAIVVRRCLVKEDQMLRERVNCARIDGTTMDCELAEVEIETPWIRGKVKAVCMEQPLFDVIVGQVEGLKDMRDQKPNERKQVVGKQAIREPEIRRKQQHEVLGEGETELSPKQLEGNQEVEQSMNRVGKSRKTIMRSQLRVEKVGNTMKVPARKARKKGRTIFSRADCYQSLAGGGYHEESHQCKNLEFSVANS
jgi:hypothetical protein